MGTSAPREKKMTNAEQNKIIVFESKSIRRVWHNDEWYFSVVDVAGILTDSIDPGAYWRKLKQRLKEEESEVVTNCHELKLEASDGKKYKVTEYYKRLMEARTDLEKDLHNKILFILGGNPEIIREEEKTKTTKKLMSKLNNFLEVQVKPKSSSSTPTTNKGLQTTPIN